MYIVKFYIKIENLCLKTTISINFNVHTESRNTGFKKSHNKDIENQYVSNLCV